MGRCQNQSRLIWRTAKKAVAPASKSSQAAEAGQGQIHQHTVKQSKKLSPRDKLARLVEGRCDTGVVPGMDTRFNEVRTAILTGRCRPSLTQVRKQFNVGYPVAKHYLNTLCEQGVLNKNHATGHYRLV